MPCFAGLDVSKRTTQICIMDRDGAIFREGAVETTPKSIAGFLRGERRRYVRVGMEPGELSSWLYEGLSEAGLPIICLEARRVGTLLKAERNKTDAIDARVIATLVRTANYRAVHIKDPKNRNLRAMLSSRQLLMTKAQDTDNAIRSILFGLGVRIARSPKATFPARVTALIRNNKTAKSLIDPLLRVRTVISTEKKVIDSSLEAFALADPVCRRLMTAPQVGPLTALIFRCAIDQPLRFARSRSVGAHFGMTPKTRQSGEVSRQGRISGWGDHSVRRALYLAARGFFRKNTRPSWLSVWAMEIAAKRGRAKAIVAAARRLAVVLHRMWVSETDFRWEAHA